MKAIAAPTTNERNFVLSLETKTPSTKLRPMGADAGLRHEQKENT